MLGNAALDTLLDGGRGTIDATAKIYGVVPAIVLSNHDKNQSRHQMGMVQVYFPWLQSQKAKGGVIMPWARVLMPTAGKGSGFYTVPQSGDEVCVGFEHGDIHFPYVLGSVWNGVNKIPAPTTPADGQDCKGHHQGPPTHKTPGLLPDSLAGDKGVNKVYFWRSRTGHLIIMDDKGGTIRIADRTGKSMIQLEKEQIKVLQRSGDIVVYASKKIRFDCENFEVHATKDIKFECDNNWSAKAAKDVLMEAGAKFTATAKTGITHSSKAGIEVIASSGVKITAGTEMSIAASSKALKMTAGMGVNITAAKDVAIQTKQNLNMMSLMGVTVMALSDINIKANATINCLAMCINLN